MPVPSSHVYVRVSSRKNKTGQVVRYLQLAHNEWDPDAGVSRTKVLHSFGREDDVDRPAIQRLITALSRLLDPAHAAALTGPAELTFTDSRPLGGAHLLDGLWRRLGIDTAIRAALAGSRADAGRVERILFALVANRALAPSSKLAATDWITHDVHIDGLPEVHDEACYRAMDVLLGIEKSVTEQIYHQVADLLNLQVDVLFFDTTSTYFETGEPDERVARDEHGRRDPDPQAVPDDDVRDVGFRTHGKSKDHRDDLPQVVIGMAVTREGIPVRVWSWPGNTSDSKLIRQVKDDMRDWSLARIVWVADRGFSSAENRRYLQRGGGHYIIGEKLRTDSDDVQTALSRPGRYANIRDNMQVKEVTVDDAGDRFVICYNPEHLRSTASGSTSTRKVWLSWGNGCWPPSGRVTRRPGLCWSGTGQVVVLVGDVSYGDGLIAVGAERAGVEAGSRAVAVVAPLLPEGAGVASGAVINRNGASRCPGWQNDDGFGGRGVVAATPGLLPAGGCAVALTPDRGERVAADRAGGCRLVVVTRRWCRLVTYRWRRCRLVVVTRRAHRWVPWWWR